MQEQAQEQGAQNGSAELLQKVHLVVLHHGLWGLPQHLHLLENLLTQVKETMPKSSALHVLNLDCNSKFLSYDGIDVCGERAVAQIQERLQRQRVDQISLIGYSMGGLVQRFVAGRLYAAGVFDKVQAMNFVTIATPHLGAARPATTLFNRAYTYVGSFYVQRSGCQLMLSDSYHEGEPLLKVLCGGPFLTGLQLFKRRALYANVYFDRTVPYPTASISLSNPYAPTDVVTVPISPQYPSLVKAIHKEQVPDGYQPREAVTLSPTALGAVFVLSPLIIAGMVGMGLWGWAHHSWRAPASLASPEWLKQHSQLLNQETLSITPASSSMDLAHVSAPPVTVPPRVEACADGTSKAEAPAGPHTAQQQQHCDAAATRKRTWAEGLFSSFWRHHKRPAVADNQLAAAGKAAANAAQTASAGTHSSTLHTLARGAGARSFAQMASELPQEGEQSTDDLTQLAAQQTAGLGAEQAAGAPSDAGDRQRLALLQRQEQLLRYMAEQLNGKLVWEKYDVDTGHMHSHGAIIVRNAKYHRNCDDVMQHCVAHLAL